MAFGGKISSYWISSYWDNVSESLRQCCPMIYNMKCPLQPHVSLNFLLATLKIRKKILKIYTLFYSVYPKCCPCSRHSGARNYGDSLHSLICTESLKSAVCFRLHLPRSGLGLSGLGQCGPKDTVAFFSYHEAMPDTKAENGWSLEGIVLGLGAAANAEGAFGFINSSALSQSLCRRQQLWAPLRKHKRGFWRWLTTWSIQGQTKCSSVTFILLTGGGEGTRLHETDLCPCVGVLWRCVFRWSACYACHRFIYPWPNWETTPGSWI